MSLIWLDFGDTVGTLLVTRSTLGDASGLGFHNATGADRSEGEMADRVFVLNTSNVLTPMSRVGFKSEDIFQALLADHPEILGETEAGVPLLISREQGIADSFDTGDRWSLDHLYLDTSGVPILVEVKRATDTRARREVVAQMLDYASHAVNYWTLDQIQKAFQETCESRGDNPDDILTQFLPSGREVEDYWKGVEANLRAGRIRMLFVADEISRELRRIIEFLNEQMRPAEVLGIEVEHYGASDGSRTLVPKLVGLTERATGTKAVIERPNISTIEEWLERLRVRCGDDTREGAAKAVGIFQSLGCEVAPTSSKDALYVKVVAGDGKPGWPFFIRHSVGGRIELALAYLKNRPAFADDASRREALQKFQAIQGLEVRSTEKLNGYPSFAAAVLLGEANRKAFADFASWVVKKASQT